MSRGSFWRPRWLDSSARSSNRSIPINNEKGRSPPCEVTGPSRCAGSYWSWSTQTHTPPAGGGGAASSAPGRSGCARGSPHSVCVCSCRSALGALARWSGGGPAALGPGLDLGGSEVVRGWSGLEVGGVVDALVAAVVVGRDEISDEISRVGARVARWGVQRARARPRARSQSVGRNFAAACRSWGRVAAAVCWAGRDATDVWRYRLLTRVTGPP